MRRSQALELEVAVDVSSHGIVGTLDKNDSTGQRLAVLFVKDLSADLRDLRCGMVREKRHQCQY